MSKVKVIVAGETIEIEEFFLNVAISLDKEITNKLNQDNFERIFNLNFNKDDRKMTTYHDLITKK